MKRQLCAVIFYPVVAGIVAVATSLRADDATVANTRLRTVYSEEHTLREFCPPGAHAVVLVFMGTDCPVVRQYLPTLNALAAEFSAANIRFLAIYSNVGDNVMAIALHAQRGDLEFPALQDSEHRLADLLNVKTMSEVVVLNGNFEIHYQGAIDNQFTRRGRLPNATEHYLHDALTQFVEGRRIEQPLLPASGCAIERGPGIRPNPKLTFHKDIAPLIQRHCQTCHRPGEAGPFPLQTYDDVANYAETIEEVVLDRRMPPWHGVLNEKLGKLHNDKRLSDTEIRTLVSWIRAEMPEGDPSDAPPAVRWPSSKVWAVGKPDFVYQMDRPFRVPAQGVVNYQFFRVPMNLTRDHWVQAIQVRPGNREVVHHIGLHLVPAGNEDYSGLAMAALFGLTGDRAQPLNDYVPGDLNNHKEYPAHRAVRIPKGSDLIFEVHYTPNGQPTTDRSQVAIRWSRQQPEEEVLTKVFRKPRGGFRIPAGATNYRMEDTYYFEQDVLIDSIRPHMHARGHSYRLDRVERDPVTDEIIDRELVLAVPLYDVNWQRTYELETPLWLAAGTELLATVYFDNSRFNPHNPDPKTDVFWGLQSTDEMLSTRFQYRLAPPPEEHNDER